MRKSEKKEKKIRTKVILQTLHFCRRNTAHNSYAAIQRNYLYKMAAPSIVRRHPVYFIQPCALGTCELFCSVRVDTGCSISPVLFPTSATVLLLVTRLLLSHAGRHKKVSHYADLQIKNRINLLCVIFFLVAE